MKTLQQIKDAHINAIKTQNTVGKALFSTLKGAIENELKSGTTKSENDIIESIAKKFTENAKVMNTEDAKTEIELLKPFLAAELDDSEYSKIANQVVTDNSDKAEQYKNGNKNVLGAFTGSFMKIAKEIHKGVAIDANKAKNALIEILEA